jgi:hypothetical protein
VNLKPNLLPRLDVSTIEEAFDDGTEWMGSGGRKSLLELKGPKYDRMGGMGNWSNEVLQQLNQVSFFTLES